MNNRELAGRVALVTGVTRRAGIGAAIARELGRAGARVFVTWLPPVRPGASLGNRTKRAGIAACRTCVDRRRGLQEQNSISVEPGSPAELFRRALQRFDGVDILVNNAAHWEGGGISEVRADQLDRHYAVNVRASVLLCSEFARHKRPDTPGRIINITSGQNQNPMPGEIAYVVTKSALDALTLTLSAELAGCGVTVNAVDPGPTDTGWISDELRSKLTLESPGGISSPEAIGRLVRLIAGDDAASITGRVIRAQAAETALLLARAAG